MQKKKMVYVQQITTVQAAAFVHKLSNHLITIVHLYMEQLNLDLITTL